MYSNVDYVPPARTDENNLKRRPSENSNIYLQEESIYEPTWNAEKPDVWRLSSNGSSGDDIRLRWHQDPQKQSCPQRHKVLIGMCVTGLMLVLAISVLGFVLQKFYSMRAEIQSLKEDQIKLKTQGAFFIYNEDHKLCAEVRSSTNHLTASTCSPESSAQYFRWLPGCTLMSTNESRCVGVEKKISGYPLRLYECDSKSVLNWVCPNVTLLGIQDDQLYFNYGNNKEKVVMLYKGTKEWSRWRARSPEGKLLDGGVCGQCCA
ncbi:macrophage mannose receptor 1-like [Hyperolius riggenbachi]|uniref:macrophage mannose receptor 1-like n=1 Tax=Hyperolius riggenbachi TaxID=752182 RepID=UPI0035A36BA3